MSIVVAVLPSALKPTSHSPGRRFTSGPFPVFGFQMRMPPVWSSDATIAHCGASANGGRSVSSGGSSTSCASPVAASSDWTVPFGSTALIVLPSALNRGANSGVFSGPLNPSTGSSESSTYRCNRSPVIAIFVMSGEKVYSGKSAAVR